MCPFGALGCLVPGRGRGEQEQTCSDSTGKFLARVEIEAHSVLVGSSDHQK